MVIEDQRPDPDSLLSLVNQDTEFTKKGKLKIFFGSSAGVGKTFSMLSDATALKNEGVDVIVGVIETHGRHETAKMLEGLPVLPLKQSLHKGIPITEFDIEAALIRKPQLILIDELAHTNAPDSRHPKRWMDVKELIDNGIDVYTTLNVQHLESVNDVITKVTGIIVKETLPDEIFDKADDIELIDIPSDELLKRLKQGKVYVAPGASKRALENFFKKTNLVALREIALRRTAERVDAQMDLLTSASGQKEAQIGEKILVCLGHDDLSTKVIRHAKRMATRSKAALIGIYIETSRHTRLTEKAKVNVERNIRLAERLGAKIVNVSGNNAADEIINYASYNGITRIIIGSRTQKFSINKKSLAEDLIRKSSGLEITTVTEAMSGERKRFFLRMPKLFNRPSSYAYTFMMVALFTLLCIPFRKVIDNDDFTMFYMVVITYASARYGVAAGIASTIFSILFFKIFFTTPQSTFLLRNPSYYYTIAIMLATGIITGSLASKLSLQVRQARKREQETTNLYNLTKELSKTRGVENMTEASIQQVNEAFNVDAKVYFSNEHGLTSIPPEMGPIDYKEESVARWVFSNAQLAGRNTDTLPSAKGLYLPLIAEDQVLGVLCLIPKDENYNFSNNQISKIETFASIIGSSFQRGRKAEMAEKVKIESESEKMRNILLSSVSHDLRTPLASITGAASSLIMMKDKSSKAADDLLKSIHSQTARLSRLVTNLLDVTNLESGNIKLNKQPYFIDELIGTSLIRVEEIKGNKIINVLVEPDLPLINVDGILIEQVIINLLENAIRFTPDEGYIEIEVNRIDDEIKFSITDNGKGINSGDEKKIFEKFYTQTTLGAQHSGLGLTICRGIIHTHDGQIWAENLHEGGAKFSFTLPVMKEVEMENNNQLELIS